MSHYLNSTSPNFTSRNNHVSVLFLEQPKVRCFFFIFNHLTHFWKFHFVFVESSAVSSVISYFPNLVEWPTVPTKQNWIICFLNDVFTTPASLPLLTCYNSIMQYTYIAVCEPITDVFSSVLYCHYRVSIVWKFWNFS